LGDDSAAADRLCELNVIEQVANVCHTTIARDAWERGQALAVHGWIYGIHNGLLKNLNVTVSDFSETAAAHRTAIAAVCKKPAVERAR
ncbi:MAG: carbonic anhydrase, partial [Verrucomicrobiota bacterium]|nr:carbonic anhydrase [Verrucomicrobiota bacterium]